MKPNQSSGIGPAHQPVAQAFEIKTANKAIAIQFTNQRLGPHAGSATFSGWLRSRDWIKRLAEALHIHCPPPMITCCLQQKVTIRSLRFWLFITRGNELCAGQDHD
jgi:hypothetical protein